LTARPDTYTADRLAWLEQVALDAELGHLAARTATVLALRYLNRETGDAWPSQETLASDLSVTSRAIRTAIGQLSGHGHLTVQVRTGTRTSSRYRPILKAENRNNASGSEVQRTGTVLPGPETENRMFSAPRTGSRLPTNPLKEPFEKSAARLGDEKRLSEEIFALLPKGSTSRSNPNLVGQAVASIIAEGVNPKSLRYAVARFVKEAPDAKDEDGRFMGKAHEWLTTKRGWEAFTPSPDTLFALDLPEADQAWVSRVRNWLRHDWSWRPHEWGPVPGEPGCRVPLAIIEHCR
jgi:biotin operon repressor